jgi:hypothetical protein
VTRTEAIADLREVFGSIEEHPLPVEPGLMLVVVAARQAVPNSEQTTQVAFKLPEDIAARPQHFVEPHLVLPTGQQPNNTSTQELDGRLWKTWSLNTPWEPSRHTMSQLVDTVVKQWDR